MKKIVVILTIAAFALTSCGGEKKKDNVDTHTHEDGTVHKDHTPDVENKALPAQESFEVEVDSAHQNAADTLYNHDHGHDHEGVRDHQH